MTVAQLIRRLQHLPPDAEVHVEAHEYAGYMNPRHENSPLESVRTDDACFRLGLSDSKIVVLSSLRGEP